MNVKQKEINTIPKDALQNMNTRVYDRPKQQQPIACPDFKEAQLRVNACVSSSIKLLSRESACSALHFTQRGTLGRQTVYEPGGIAQPVQRRATGWMAKGSFPGSAGYLSYPFRLRGHAVVQYATSPKVKSWIPDEIIGSFLPAASWSWDRVPGT
jgi:hypothetical protein